MIKSALKLAAIGLALTMSFVPLSAQSKTAGTMAADPADVATVDSIVAAVYASISGPKGQRRDWDRFRSLFFKDARLIPSGANTPAGATSLTVDAYIKRADQFFFDNGFFEREIGRAQHAYGNIVQVFSTYDSKRTLEDAEPFARGINSIQLLKHSDRWWVMNIFWQGETPDYPIPQEYLN
ncbi:Cif family virulence factor [Kordiimonas aquimaris]|uniref:hypothetical protein n=1 Tax=Kordiimonas aquimaris TaxID=707591 RepID=UPI0021D04D94|nr:hypothetical protein [Kordiimonas aquimaris]